MARCESRWHGGRREPRCMLDTTPLRNPFNGEVSCHGTGAWSSLENRSPAMSWWAGVMTLASRRHGARWIWAVHSGSPAQWPTRPQSRHVLFCLRAATWGDCGTGPCRGRIVLVRRRVGLEVSVGRRGQRRAPRRRLRGRAWRPRHVGPRPRSGTLAGRRRPCRHLRGMLGALGVSGPGPAHRRRRSRYLRWTRRPRPPRPREPRGRDP